MFGDVSYVYIRALLKYPWFRRKSHKFFCHRIHRLTVLSKIIYMNTSWKFIQLFGLRNSAWYQCCVLYRMYTDWHIWTSFRLSGVSIWYGRHWWAYVFRSNFIVKIGKLIDIILNWDIITHKMFENCNCSNPNVLTHLNSLNLFRKFE